MGDFAKYLSDYQRNGYPYSYNLAPKDWSIFGVVIFVGLIIAIFSYAYTKTVFGNE